ncbi:MAG: thymidine phosphorylase [Ruminococcaceae bacterium]|nr:thymidine phosphorylase [Oscillospiraceae bacterium]
MHITDIIIKKRDGGKLNKSEIEYVTKEYTAGNIPDYQISALLMAICLKGMDEEETENLTFAIRDSGETVDLSPIDGVKIDKHSTGGVGDKTTLIVAPLVASLGIKVAKMSGRGLGHTGGTVDKLESIKGFRTSLSKEEFFAAVNSAGLAVSGQSGNLAPADKKLYALRDVTGTVENHSLIVSSIMGKKLASGADGIVLDVKVGSGSFNKTPEDAEKLAKAMVKIGGAAGKKTAALLTDMDVPLGKAIGNALEVKEALEVLHGGGDSTLAELCTELAAVMLHLGDKGSIDECRNMAKDALASGKAFKSFVNMVKAQGGDAECIYNPDLLPTASFVYPVKAEKTGYITVSDAKEYGRASLILGAGRERKEDGVDHAAGIIMEKRRGDKVQAGEVIAYLHTNRENAIAEAARVVLSATEIGDEAPKTAPVVRGLIL